VCVIEMLKMKAGAVDSGDIWGSGQTQIPNEATLSQLRDMLGKQGGDLLVSVLRRMSHSKVEARPQEVCEQLKVAPMITAANRFVDPRLQTADQIVQIYRSLEKPVVVKFHRPDQSQVAGGTLLQLHQPAAVPLRSSVNRDMDPPSSGLRTTKTGAETAEDTSKPPVGFGIFDRKRTNCLIIGCRDETYLRIRSVQQENRALLDVHEWWNGLGACNRPIRLSDLA